ncbi:ribosome maturation protein RlbA [Bacillus vallismortis]|uniref:ribosome maturation protein RlbA n=1 Tax=Bacillus vallismortis TaxID=72361 RepID=UPI002DBDDC83|nr:ribosome maturation protein RlbA [Bacillus vallismortis]MEC1650175.1 ribosome maturation protein RlbA [Bacillus vallismortis]
MANPISIDTEMITLGQFLKLADVIQSGGMAKWFLSEHEVLVNKEPDNRRGRKLYVGDVVEIEGFGSFQVVN